MSSVLSLRFSAALISIAIVVNAAAGAQLNTGHSQATAKHFLTASPVLAQSRTTKNSTQQLATAPINGNTYEYLRDTVTGYEIAGVRAFFDNDCMGHLDPNAFYAVFPTNGRFGWAMEKLWERQYLQDLLFRDAQQWHLCVLNVGTLGLGPLVQLLEHGNKHGKPVTLIASTNEANLGLEDIAGFLTESQARVKLFIHLSDERLNQDVQKYTQIVAHDGLVLRQYHNWKQRYPEGIRVRTIPLGYSSEYPLNADSCSAAMQSSPRNTSRAYAWSWVGNVHGSEDRQTMIDMLATSPSLKPFVHEKCDAKTMYNLYHNSMFVPIGRGYISLDCFRIYEAAIAGAVPVVVGPTSEIIGTFANDKPDQDPPFVFASTWHAAAEKMDQLIQDPIKLQNLARRLGPWYCNWIQSLRAEVAEVLGH